MKHKKPVPVFPKVEPLNVTLGERPGVRLGVVLTASGVLDALSVNKVGTALALSHEAIQVALHNLPDVDGEEALEQVDALHALQEQVKLTWERLVGLGVTE